MIFRQKVSLVKLSVYFSKHVKEDDRAILATLMRVQVPEGKCKYLGLPYLMGRSKRCFLLHKGRSGEEN